MQENMSAAPQSQKRQRNREEEFDENPAHFRRVRLRYSDQTHEPGSSQAAQETDISPNGSFKNSRNKAASKQAESVATPVQMSGVIASTSTDSTGAFNADAEQTIPDFSASTSTSKSPAAKDELSSTFSSAPEEDLRHPIGGSYIPNAQLVSSSDEESGIFGSPPAEEDEQDLKSFFFSNSYSGKNHFAAEVSVQVQSPNQSPRPPYVLRFSNGRPA